MRGRKVLILVPGALLALAAGWPSGGSASGSVTLLERLSTIETTFVRERPPANTTPPLDTRINELTGRLRTELHGVTTARERVDALNRFIFERLAIESSDDLSDPDNLLLSAVLERRRGYCVGIASLYLVLAERLELPIFAVATPDHLFLRYDDGGTRINIETVRRGATMDDVAYIRDHRIAAVSIDRGVFLRNLTDEQFLAQVHNNLGVIHSRRGDLVRAAGEYDLALHLDPHLPAAHYNRGNDLLHQGSHRAAARAFGRSLRLYPNDPWALNNRGLAYLQRRRLSKARRDWEAALAIDPSFDLARRNLESLARDQPESDD